MAPYKKNKVQFERDNLIVSDNRTQYKIDLRKRLLDFAVNTIQFLSTIPYKKEYDVF